MGGQSTNSRIFTKHKHGLVAKRDLEPPPGAGASLLSLRDN